MKRVTAYIRPHRLEEVKAVLMDAGVSGLTVNDVRGCGNSPESANLVALASGVVALPVRSKLTMIVANETVEAVVESLLHCLRTGESGDGKIFVEPVLDAIRIRTQERGETAI